MCSEGAGDEYVSECERLGEGVQTEEDDPEGTD
jgi:hypothetical protein